MDERSINCDKFLSGLTIAQTATLLEHPNCKGFISVDNVIQHLGAAVNRKGLAVFTCTNSKMFGHDCNINLQCNWDSCQQKWCHGGMEPRRQWFYHSPCKEMSCWKTIKISEVEKAIKNLIG